MIVKPFIKAVITSKLTWMHAKKINNYDGLAQYFFADTAL